jgi:hypothetical protein
VIQTLMVMAVMMAQPQTSDTVTVGDWLVGDRGGKCSAVHFLEREAGGRVNVQGRALLYTFDGQGRSITFQDPSWRFEPGARAGYVLRFQGGGQDFETDGAVARAGNSITTVPGSSGAALDWAFAHSNTLALQYHGETLGAFDISGSADVLSALQRCAAGAPKG